MVSSPENDLRLGLKERLKKEGCKVLLLDHTIGGESFPRLRKVLEGATIDSLVGATVEKNDYDIVLIRAPAPIGAEVVALAKTSACVVQFKRSNPKAFVGCVFPAKYDGLQCKRAIELVRCSLGLDLGSYEVISPSSFPTLADFLLDLITQDGSLKAEKHGRSNYLWNKYLVYIDQSLRAGNSQTSLPYSFLVLSDREAHALGSFTSETVEKVKLRSLEYKLEKEDLTSCAAIFVDNDWNEITHKSALGNGIKALRNIRSELDEKSLKIPIIYQSGHDLSEFSDAEIKEIESLGAVLATKDIFPKVCKGKSVSDKELEVSRIARSDPRLSRYTAQVYEFGSLGREPSYVVCSKIVSKTNIEERTLLANLGLSSDLITHRMYVLALFHSVMKGHLLNDKLKSSSVDFFTFDEIKERAVAEKLECLRPRYESIVAEQRALSPSTIIHGDAKWDNWFAENVLGDFGSVQPGREYKDVAKVMLDGKFELAKSPELRKSTIDSYLVLRRSMDPSFNENDLVFRRRTEDMVLTESLRTLAYKADQDIAKHLLDLVLSL